MLLLNATAGNRLRRGTPFATRLPPVSGYFLIGELGNATPIRYPDGRRSTITTCYPALPFATEPIGATSRASDAACVARPSFKVKPRIAVRNVTVQPLMEKTVSGQTLDVGLQHLRMLGVTHSRRFQAGAQRGFGRSTGMASWAPRHRVAHVLPRLHRLLANVRAD